MGCPHERRLADLTRHITIFHKSPSTRNANSDDDAPPPLAYNTTLAPGSLNLSRRGAGRASAVATRACVCAAAAAGGVDAAVEVPVEMSEREKFLFDLQGFLTIEGFLSQPEVAALNESFDANWEKRGDCHQTPAYDEFGGMLTWEQPYCQPFRDLLAHPKLVPYLNTMMGRGWRLDHTPFMITGTAETKLAKGMGDDAPGGGGGHGFSGPFFNGECCEC